MQIAGLLLENFTTLFLSTGLGILIVSNRNFDKKINRSFIIFILIIIGLVAVEITDQWCSALDKVSVLRYVAATMGYVLRPASIAILVSILLLRGKTYFVLWIPIVSIALISFSSPYTHLMFWFTEDNFFMRGPLSYISHICSLVYVALLLVLSIKRHKNITSSEIFIVLFSSGICIMATVLETFRSDCHFLITSAMAVSCTLYYVVLYAETFKVDQLTGLLNRKSLYANAARMKDRQFAVISMDLNCLKAINDLHGHSAGDRALKSFANILVANGGKEYRPYRLGGDEFIILSKEINDQEIETFIDQVRMDLRKENLMSSFGYAIFNRGDSFDNVCNQADKRMYEDKKEYKKEKENMHRRRN